MKDFTQERSHFPALNVVKVVHREPILFHIGERTQVIDHICVRNAENGFLRNLTLSHI